MQKKIALIATDISFNTHSIVYDVKFETDLEGVLGVCFSDISIADKDLIMKPTIISKESMKVVFVPVNVTPHFYQAIHKKIIRHLSEYEVEKRNIYNVGDVVGYILI